MGKISRILAAGLCLLWMGAAMTTSTTKTRTYAADDSAFPNAQIGYAPMIDTAEAGDAALRYLELTWREAEPKEGVYAWEAISEKYDFASLREQGIHLVPFEPRDFLISRNDQETLTTPQLHAFIERQKMRGAGNVKPFEIEIHRRYAMTAAAFILTVIGMSLSSRKVKGGMGINIGIGLVLSFSYILFMTVTSTFAVSGLTSPLVAMWIPNLIYSIVALVLYFKAAR